MLHFVSCRGGGVFFTRLPIAVYYATGGPVEDGPSQALPFLLSLLIYDVLLVTLVTCAKPQY